MGISAPKDTPLQRQTTTVFLGHFGFRSPPNIWCQWEQTWVKQNPSKNCATSVLSASTLQTFRPKFARSFLRSSRGCKKKHGLTCGEVSWSSQDVHFDNHTVDASEIRQTHQLVVYVIFSIICRVFWHHRRSAGFLPSTVCFAWVAENPPHCGIMTTCVRHRMIWFDIKYAEKVGIVEKNPRFLPQQQFHTQSSNYWRSIILNHTLGICLRWLEKVPKIFDESYGIESVNNPPKKQPKDSLWSLI